MRRSRRASSRMTGWAATAGAATAAPARTPPATTTLAARLVPTPEVVSAGAHGSHDGFREGPLDDREAAEHDAERAEGGEGHEAQQEDHGEPALALRQFHHSPSEFRPQDPSPWGQVPRVISDGRAVSLSALSVSPAERRRRALCYRARRCRRWSRGAAGASAAPAAAGGRGRRPAAGAGGGRPWRGRRPCRTGGRGL